jgi:hypothetical protein
MNFIKKKVFIKILQQFLVIKMNKLDYNVKIWEFNII